MGKDLVRYLVSISVESRSHALAWKAIGLFPLLINPFQKKKKLKFIMDESDGLISACLNFVKAVVDVEDLPSDPHERETLQQNMILHVIKRICQELPRDVCGNFRGGGRPQDVRWTVLARRIPPIEQRSQSFCGSTSQIPETSRSVQRSTSIG